MADKYLSVREQMILARVIDTRVTGPYDSPKMSEAEMKNHMYPANSDFSWRKDVAPFQMPEAWRPI